MKKTNGVDIRKENNEMKKQIDTNKLLERLDKVRNFMTKYGPYLMVMLIVTFMVVTLIDPAFAAADYEKPVKEIVKGMVDIIKFIFKVIGVILAVYSVGQLVLAFKNEDADSKSRASTQLVVAIVLIAMPSIIDSLKLVDNL